MRRQLLWTQSVPTQSQLAFQFCFFSSSSIVIGEQATAIYYPFFFYLEILVWRWAIAFVRAAFRFKRQRLAHCGIPFHLTQFKSRRCLKLSQFALYTNGRDDDGGDEKTANRIVHKIDGIARNLWHYECAVVTENQLVYATDCSYIWRLHLCVARKSQFKWYHNIGCPCVYD